MIIHSRFLTGVFFLFICTLFLGFAGGGEIFAVGLCDAGEGMNSLGGGPVRTCLLLPCWFMILEAQVNDAL